MRAHELIHDAKVLSKLDQIVLDCIFELGMISTCNKNQPDSAPCKASILRGLIHDNIKHLRILESDRSELREAVHTFIIVAPGLCLPQGVCQLFKLAKVSMDLEKIGPLLPRCPFFVVRK